uniref:GDP-mannose 4,6-dehydratase n=1 Tax=candidate division WWE3 bacterium TaxID=2053526 RepID=A0A7C4TPG6_UNCKA
MSKKKALITGITGQDGSYLAELLLRKGYEVHGIVRRTSTFTTRERIDHIFKIQKYSFNPKATLNLHYGDVSESNSVYKILITVRPDEIYHLAAQSHVKISFENPEYTINTTGLSTLRFLEAIKDLELKTKFYQASSSEMFGSSPPPQSETTPFRPQSPYGAAKVLAHNLVVNYREAYNIFCVSGILFNHESPRRGENFVTRKITLSIARILAKQQDKLYLGNLDAKRDWGYAKEYVNAMWLILQHKKPEDFVIATGETHSVREFVETAFELVGLNWKKYVKIDPFYFRPADVNDLRGDYTKARKILDWKPKVKFKELIRIMLNSDLKSQGLTIKV